MSYNEELKNDNFDILSGISNSYYDDIFCPTNNQDEYISFPKKMYTGNKKNIESVNKNFNDCKSRCDNIPTCKGYAFKNGNKCELYGSYPKINELAEDQNFDYYIKKPSFNFDQLSQTNKDRIQNYCQDKSVKKLYEKTYNKKYDGIEKCVTSITKKRNNHNKFRGYINLDTHCIWKTLNKPIHKDNYNFKNNQLGKTKSSSKLDNYQKNFKELKTNNEKYKKIENELSIYDKPDYFPEYYKLLDESYGKVETGVESFMSETKIEENFVTKGGPKREKLEKVKDYGCNNIIFILLIIPFLVGIYLFFYRMQTGKNKNL